MKHPLSTFGAAGATNAAVFAFVLVNGVLMARLLGPAGRGAVFTTVALPTAAAALVGSWVYPVLVRRAACSSAGSSERLLNTLCLRATLPLAAVTALLSWLLIVCFGRQLDGPARWMAVVYAALWAPLSLLILNFQAHDLGRARWRRYNVLRLLPYPVILAGLLACFIAGRRDPAGVLVVLLASNLPPAVARLWLARRDGGREEEVARVEMGGLYREALPFLAASGGTAALTYADQVVAAALLPGAEAGLYAVAQRMSLLLTPLSTAAGAVSLSEAARAPEAERPRRAWRGPVVFLLAGLGLALAPAVWYLVPVLYGREFAGARVAALLALAAGVLAALADFREQRLEGSGRPLRALPGRAGGAMALVAVAVPAALRWGPAGIAAGSVAGQCVRGLLLFRSVGRR